MTAHNTHATQPSAPASTANASSQSNQRNASPASDSGFDLFLDRAATTQDIKPTKQNPAADKNADSKSSKPSTETDHAQPNKHAEQKATRTEDTAVNDPGKDSAAESSEQQAPAESADAPIQTINRLSPDNVAIQSPAVPQMLVQTDEVNNCGTETQNSTVRINLDELKAMLQQTTDETGPNAEPSATSSSAPKTNTDKLTLADSKQQILNAEGEDFLKKLTSIAKNDELSKSSLLENNPIATINNKTQDTSSLLPKQAVLENAETTRSADHETALLQQQAQTAKNFPSNGETRTENTNAASRSFMVPEQDDTRAYFSSNGNRLAVSLEPDGLGKLNINLSLDRGVVNAQIQATDPAARTLLENNMQQIVNTLMREGLAVGGFSVSLKQSGDGGEQEQNVDKSLRSQEQSNAIAAVAHPDDQNGRINIFV